MQLGHGPLQQAQAPCTLYLSVPLLDATVYTVDTWCEFRVVVYSVKEL